MPLQRLIRGYFLKHYYFLVGQFLRYTSSTVSIWVTWVGHSSSGMDSSSFELDVIHDAGGGGLREEPVEVITEGKGSAPSRE